MAAEGGVLAEEPPDKHAIGSRQAAFALFKAMVGPGLLFLPAAVKNAGALLPPPLYIGTMALDI